MRARGLGIPRDKARGQELCGMRDALLTGMLFVVNFAVCVMHC